MRHVLLAAAAAALILPAQAMAQGRSADDLRCAMAMLAAGDSTEESPSEQGLFAIAFYYLGRVSGRDPGFITERRLEAAGESLAKMSELQLFEFQAKCAEDFSSAEPVFFAD